MKEISILGSTGSIGTQALQVVDLNHTLKVEALCANKNVDLMERQVRRYKPRLAGMTDEAAARTLKTRLADLDVKVTGGPDAAVECACCAQSELVLTAMVGVCGLVPTIEAIRAGKDIALANKETLVAGGSLVMPLAAEKGIRILPVDSEHSAIFQSMQGSRAHVNKILLTASGGPFFGKKGEEIYDIPVEQALNHPRWEMGAKVTVDSATLMNKGLELIEASWLFDLPPEQIQVVVHRQSVIHSMVEYEDHSVIAQLSATDMRLPIAYALTWPDRRPCGVAQLDFFALAQLTFERPDEKTFPCLALARQAALTGGSMPAAMNAANEIAVSAYLQRRIRFGEIPELINSVMTAHTVIKSPSLADVLDTDREIRDIVERRIAK